MKYIVYTESYDLKAVDGSRVKGWSALITDENGVQLISRDGDNEPEAIAIAFTEWLGNLPHDFPRELIDVNATEDNA